MEDMMINELNQQIKEWRRQQDLYEEMIEAAYERIDEIEYNRHNNFNEKVS